MATTFTFQMRAHAAAHFERDAYLSIDFPDGLKCVFQSEYTGGESGHAYPVTIHGEIRGDFETLPEAQARLSGIIGGDLLPVFALATNAAIETPMPIACFGVDLSEPRPFLGYRTPPASSYFPPGKRRIDLEALGVLLNAVGTHGTETAILRRAVGMFRLALEHWNPAERLLGGEFLFISAETLSRFLLESRAKARGITTRNLARAEGVTSADALRECYMAEIFDGEEDAIRALEKASNGFEHGYMAIGKTRQTMEPVLERCLACVRAGLIEAAGVDEATLQRLLSDDYKEPRPIGPTIAVVEGQLGRADESIPAAEELPFGLIDLTWSERKTIATEKDGDVQFEFSWEVTIENLPENGSLAIERQGLQANYISLARDDHDPMEDPEVS